MGRRASNRERSTASEISKREAAEQGDEADEARGGTRTASGGAATCAPPLRGGSHRFAAYPRCSADLGVTVDPRSRAAFGLVILAQTAHSVEEYLFRLYDVFGPARFVSLLFSSSPTTGFAIANVGIVLFGVWCYFARVRASKPSGRAFAWFWACLELGNGIGHMVLSGLRGAYFPGVATAPLLVAASGYLAFCLTRLGRAS